MGTRYRKYSSRNTIFLRLNIGPFKLVLCKDLLRSVQMALVKTRSVQKNILCDNSSCTTPVPLLSRVFHGVSTSIIWRLQLNVEVWHWYSQFLLHLDSDYSFSSSVYVFAFYSLEHSEPCSSTISFSSWRAGTSKQQSGALLTLFFRHGLNDSYIHRDIRTAKCISELKVPRCFSHTIFNIHDKI